MYALQEEKTKSTTTGSIMNYLFGIYLPVSLTRASSGYNLCLVGLG